MDDTRQKAIDALIAEINEANGDWKRALITKNISDQVDSHYRLNSAAKALAVLTSPQGA